MTDRELLQQALEALEWEWGGEPLGSKTWAAIDAIRTRLAEPEPEPVGEVVEDEIFDGVVRGLHLRKLPPGTKLYTHPPQQRRPLTDEQKDDMIGDSKANYLGDGVYHIEASDLLGLLRAVERTHRIG